MTTININEIIVPKSFSKPSEKKMDAVRRHMEKHGVLDQPVVLQGDLLVDGYVRYLVAKEYKMERIPFVQSSDLNNIEKPTMFIVGKFKYCDKEYTWRVPSKIKIKVGDRALVDSKYGKNGHAVVTVLKVFESEDKDMMRHKPIIKKLKAAKQK